MVSDYESAVRFLLGRVNYETFQQIPYEKMRENLERLKDFLASLGQPDKRFPIIHVAGTKGKGSVCAMIDAIAAEAGLRVGRFTSPHLYSLNERFTINGVPCPNHRLVEIVEWMRRQAFMRRQTSGVRRQGEIAISVKMVHKKQMKIVRKNQMKAVHKILMQITHEHQKMSPILTRSTNQPSRLPPLASCLN